MPTSASERAIVLYFRLTMAWTFLYASSHQVFDPTFTVVGFLDHTKTFHDLFATFTTPVMAPITTILVEHNLAQVMRVCRRLLVLDQGRIIADAAPHDVMANPAVREAYLGEAGA